jgi:hypothetical protein
MKTILLFQWFDCRDPVRRAEFTACAEHNLRLGFDEIVIFNDSTEPAFDGAHVRNVPADRRLTYRDFVDLLVDPANEGALVCATNTDIKLDPRLLDLTARVQKQQLLCFSRYEADGQLAKSPWCTHDTWVALGQPVPDSVVLQSSIPLGVPGCENRLAEIFFSSGFRVFNPSADIRNTHVHSVPSVHSDEKRLYGAYAFVPVCASADIGRDDLMPKPVYLPKFAMRLFKIG